MGQVVGHVVTPFVWALPTLEAGTDNGSRGRRRAGSPPPRCRTPHLASLTCRWSRAPSTTWARPWPTSPSSSSTSRPPAAARPSAASPRSARSRCAAARCSASSRPWSTRACRSRRSSRCSPASPTRWSPTRPAIESALPAFLEFAAGSVLVAHNAGFDIALPQGGGARTEHEWPRLRRRSTPSTSPASSCTATRRATTSWPRWPRCSARRPPPTTGPCTTRGPPSTCCTASSSGSARSACTPSRSCSATPSRVARRHAPQAPPRRRAARRARASTCSRTARAGSSTSARPCRHPHPGAQLLHRVRAAPPDGRDGAHRRVGHPDRLRHHPRGRGARAAAHRRAQAPLQPPVAQPRAGAVGQAHRRAVPAAVDRARGRRRRRPLHRPVRLAAARPRPRSPPSTRCSRCASASSGSPPPSRARPARWPTWAAAARRAPAPRASRTMPRSSADAVDAPRRRRPRPCSTALRTRMDAPGRRRSASRTPAPCATGCSPWCAAPRAPSGSTRWPRSRRARRRPAPRARRLGGRRASGTAGSPPAPSHRGAPTRCPTSTRCAPAPRSSPRSAPARAGHARGDREDPALARGPRRAHRRPRRRVDLPVGGAAVCAPSSSRSRRATRHSRLPFGLASEGSCPASLSCQGVVTCPIPRPLHG